MINREINLFKERLKQSKFYSDLWHSAEPDFILLVGSTLYGFTDENSDYDINVFVNPDTLKWPYGHCWHEFLIYQGKKVEWYYMPTELLSMLDNPNLFDRKKYNLTLAGIIAIGMLWAVSDINIIDINTTAGKEFLNKLKSDEIKNKLLNFSLTLLFNSTFKNKSVADIKNFYVWLAPKHMYRILVLFYSYLDQLPNKELILSLKNESDYLKYIDEITQIFILVKEKFENKE